MYKETIKLLQPNYENDSPKFEIITQIRNIAIIVKNICVLYSTSVFEKVDYVCFITRIIYYKYQI